MQSGGRRRHRTFLAREHGLIVGPVLLVDGAPTGDIGRQRHVAAFGERLVEHRPMKRKAERHLTALPFGLDRRVELLEEAHPAFASEAHDIADREPLRRAHQGAPARAVEPFRQRRGDRRLAIAAADAAAAETRRNHLGVVDDERIVAP
jgi:hypothetical protein